MKIRLFTLSLLLVVLLFVGCVQSRLEPTKLVDGSVFRLQNQHDGRYLTEGSNGNPTKAEYAGSPNQKFTFIKGEDADVWTLETVSTKKPLSDTIWKVSYVGHGKYQFKNSKTGTCLQASGSNEGVCDKSNPILRWFVDTVSKV